MEKFELKTNKNLIGKKIGRLLVLSFSHKDSQGLYCYNCVCDCGNHVVRNVSYFTSKKTPHKSCGCWRKELTKEKTFKHGMSLTATHRVWAGIKARCTNKNDKYYPRYGGRGIKVCDRWLHSFENFYADMGEKPEKMSLDRIDNNGNYCPENCRWATVKTQNNNRRTNIYITYRGKTMTLKQWCEKYDMIYANVQNAWYSGHKNMGYLIRTFKNRQKKKEYQVFIEYNGERKTLKEWCEVYNMNYKRVHSAYYLQTKDLGTLIETYKNQAYKVKTYKSPCRLFLEHEGKNISLKELCSIYNMRYDTVLYAYHNGHTDAKYLIEKYKNGLTFKNK